MVDTVECCPGPRWRCRDEEHVSQLPQVEESAQLSILFRPRFSQENRLVQGPPPGVAYIQCPAEAPSCPSSDNSEELSYFRGRMGLAGLLLRLLPSSSSAPLLPLPPSLEVDHHTVCSLKTSGTRVSISESASSGTNLSHSALQDLCFI